jgi:ubiquinone/menaquinone biosynthesis C-methylase UbiE
VDLDETKAGALDAALERYADELRAAGEAKAAVTLAYTHSLHRSWRTALRMLPLPGEWSVLDVGTGLGVLAFELAANLPLHVEGVDIEADFIAHAGRLLDRLRAAELFAEHASVAFSMGDISALDFDDASFDLVFVRELFQFLPDPVGAARETLRVLRPGGWACVSDMDDQLRITWPPASEALSRLVAAVAAAQHGRGGDRHAGRKLTSYLREAGFEIGSVVVMPEAHHRMVGPDDGERTLVIEQLKAVRDRVLEAGALDATTFDADVAELEREPAREEFRMNGRILVMARKPSSG